MIRVVEVGPRDGLQNEATPIPTELKLAFIESLRHAGLKEIEATSFVSPKWVPQLADADELWSNLVIGPRYTALIPNLRGMERALEVGVDGIALFTAASQAFVQKNINMTIDESLEGFRQVVARFREEVPNGWVRGYVSTIFECPYAGRIGPEQVALVAEELLEIGCDEISLGDTIGVGVPREVAKLINAIALIPKEKVAWHFHDTRGTAIANVAAALEHGYATFDASAAGLGGCPYAKGAGGNLATEDLVYFLHRSGIPTGIDLEALARASLPVLAALGRAPESRVQRAVLA